MRSWLCKIYVHYYAMGAVTTAKAQHAGKIQANFSPEKHVLGFRTAYITVAQ